MRLWLLALLLVVGCTSDAPSPSPSPPASVRVLRSPVELREILSRSAGACSRPLKPPPGGLVVTFERSECLVLGAPSLTVTRAAAVEVTGEPAWSVEVTLVPEQARELEAFTGRLAGSGGRLAIMLDREVLNAPFVLEPVASFALPADDEASARAFADRLAG